jgi:hypothetical protein
LPFFSAGLSEFLEKHFKHLANFESAEHFLTDFDSCFSNLQIVSGSTLDLPALTRLMKFFMASGQVLLDKADMPHDVKIKLESFFLENELQEDHLYFLSPVKHYTLGDGAVTLIDTNLIKVLSQQKQNQFWESLFRALNINHMEMDCFKELFLQWSSRLPHNSELDFLEVRRLSLYNPSSYRGKAKLHLKKQFKLLKIVDELNCQVQHQQSTILLEILPGGTINLDFGVVEWEE